MEQDHALDCAFCYQEFEDFRSLAEHVQTVHGPQEDNMGWKAKRESMPGGEPLLHGADLPKGMAKTKIKVTGVREAPKNFNSPYILDIEPIFGKKAWAVNKTNGDSLAVLYGDDWCEGNGLVGKTITLHIALVNNPKENKMVRSLFVQPPE